MKSIRETVKLAGRWLADPRAPAPRKREFFGVYPRSFRYPEQTVRLGDRDEN